MTVLCAAAMGRSLLAPVLTRENRKRYRAGATLAQQAVLQKAIGGQGVRPTLRSQCRDAWARDGAGGASGPASGAGHS
jgi:hypothetical protein